MHRTPFPVLLSRNLLAEPYIMSQDAGPVAFFTITRQPARYRGSLYTPTVALHVGPLRICLAEHIVWKIITFATTLQSGGGAGARGGRGGAGGVGSVGMVERESGSSSTGPGGHHRRMPSFGSSSHLVGQAGAQGGAGQQGEGQQQQQVQLLAAGGGQQQGGQQGQRQQQGQQQQALQVANADVPLQLDLLSLDDIPLRLNFKTDKDHRPRWAHQLKVLSMYGDMLNVDDLELKIPGMEVEHLRVLRSHLVVMLGRQLQDQVISIVINVFRWVRRGWGRGLGSDRRGVLLVQLASVDVGRVFGVSCIVFVISPGARGLSVVGCRHGPGGVVGGGGSLYCRPESIRLAGYGTESSWCTLAY